MPVRAERAPPEEEEEELIHPESFPLICFSACPSGHRIQDDKSQLSVLIGVRTGPSRRVERCLGQSNAGASSSSLGRRLQAYVGHQTFPSARKTPYT